MFCTRTFSTVLLISVITKAGNCQYGNGRRLKIVTILTAPYIARDAQGVFSGFIVELLDLVIPLAGYSYDITLQPDGAYGVPLPNGSWTGLVGSLIDGRADIAGAPIAINALRDSVIDFTTPILQSQTRILTNVATGLTNVKYLVVGGRSYERFLRDATSDKLRAIWANVQANNGSVANLQAGVDRVLSGEGYAIIDDGSTLRAIVDNNAGRLQLDPDVLLTQYVAFGVKQDSSLQDEISIAISKVNESGQLQTLQQKWGL